MLFLIPCALYSSDNNQSEKSSIEQDALLLENLSMKQCINCANYCKLLEATRTRAQNYVSQQGTHKELKERKQFLGQFTLKWEKNELRLFSGLDLKMWSKNWIFKTWV